jgi:transcriptional regulator
MTYPPEWRLAKDHAAAAGLMHAYPFAHLITNHAALASTRIPLIADVKDGVVVALRGHLNANNPQVAGLAGQEALVVFDGPSTYVSPHWRTDLSRAATYDYEQAQVRGLVRLEPDIGFFRRLVDDLAALIEPQYAAAGDYPVWRQDMTPAGYVERLFPAIAAFTIDVREVRLIAKLHQSFPEADRLRIAEHLDRSGPEDARAIAAKIRAQVEADRG